MVATTCHTDGRLLRNFKFASSMDTHHENLRKMSISMAESSYIRAFSLLLLAFAAMKSLEQTLRENAGSVVVWFSSDYVPKEDLEAYQAQLKQTRETKSSRFQRLLKLIHSRYAILDHPNEEGNYGPKFTEAYGASHINNIIPRKEKDPGSFTLPCFINNICFDNALVDLGASDSEISKGILLKTPFLSTVRAKIDVYKIKITLRVGEEKIIFKSVKPASSIIKRVYMLSLRERMELDLEARLMGETLVLNRSLDPLSLEPFELRRNQGDDLMPTIEEGEVIEEFRTRDEDLDIGIND
ncbi:hypothetical protein Tco_1255809 [Tanacetum coccineum]